MNGNHTYEKIVKVKMKGKQLAKTVSLIMIYGLILFFWVTAAIFNAKQLVPILVLGALSLFIIIPLTLKYVLLEYEYSFMYGRLSIAKIYGKTKRKAVIETEMSDLLIIAPATEENIARAERFEPEDRVVAVSAEDAENIWLAVTGGKDERRILVFIEADERALTLMKAASPYTFSKI